MNTDQTDLLLWNREPTDEERLAFKQGELDRIRDLQAAAVARSTDPGTSWEAARSITPEKLRESQRAVLVALRKLGPMTDETLVECLELQPRMSPSGARTRRSELVSMGLVRDSGRKDVLRSGRRAIVWEAVE